MAEVFRRGSAAFPDVRLCESTFETFVRRRWDGAIVPGALDAEGLYLACACVNGDDEALRTFERRYAALLRMAIPARLRATRALPDDFPSHLRERLMVVTAERPAALTKYSGVGSLGGWLRAMVGHLAISEARRRRDPAWEGSPVSDTCEAPEADPELAYLRQTSREVLASAFRASARALSPHERVLLDASIVRQVPSRMLARDYGVHHATVARWVQRAGQKLAEGIRTSLGRRLELRGHEVDRFIRTLCYDGELELEPLLGPDDRTPQIGSLDSWAAAVH